MNETATQRKVALITGAARRIGAQIAKTLHQQGCHVIIHYHQSEREAHDLVAQLNEVRPYSAALVQADLRDMEQMKLAVKNALAIWGQLDILVNNASCFFATPPGQLSSVEWTELMDINCKAAYFLSQMVLSALQQTNGTIINILDTYADKPLQHYAIYCASKAALAALTKALAIDLAPTIRVNAIAPGKTIWPEGKNALSEQQKQVIESAIPLQRHGDPTDVANAVVFLALHAPFMTGQTIAIDGGSSIKPIV